MIDIRTISEPRLLKQFNLAGNPDCITCINGHVIIPAGIPGMLVYQLENL